MSRLLLLVVIAVVVYLLIRSYRKKGETQQDDAAVEDMVRCAHCGVHLPRSESIKAGDKFYCSTEHRDAARG